MAKCLSCLLLLVSLCCPVAGLQAVPRLNDPASLLSRRRWCIYGDVDTFDYWWEQSTLRFNLLWKTALDETGISNENVTEFACNIPKLPWSWFQSVRSLNHTKIHNYNFQGSFMWEVQRQKTRNTERLPNAGRRRHSGQSKARNWLIPFAQENFTDHDFLNITDVGKRYQPLGLFDKSKPKTSTDRLHYSHTGFFDKDYYGVMAASNFTLCPGGDVAWSGRFFEAIAAASIPVIANRQFDWSAHHQKNLVSLPYKYYNKNDPEPLIYREDWVKHNLEVLIKYQTFHDGDNVYSP